MTPPGIPLGAAPGSDRSTDPYLPEHGNGGYRVLHYDLDLDYRVVSNRLAGQAVIPARAVQPLSRFTLDLGRVRAQDRRVDRRPAKVDHRPRNVRVQPGQTIRYGRSFR